MGACCCWSVCAEGCSFLCPGCSAVCSCPNSCWSMHDSHGLVVPTHTCCFCLFQQRTKKGQQSIQSHSFMRLHQQGWELPRRWQASLQGTTTPPGVEEAMRTTSARGTGTGTGTGRKATHTRMHTHPDTHTYTNVGGACQERHKAIDAHAPPPSRRQTNLQRPAVVLVDGVCLCVSVHRILLLRTEPLSLLLRVVQLRVRVAELRASDKQLKACRL